MSKYIRIPNCKKVEGSGCDLIKNDIQAFTWAIKGKLSKPVEYRLFFDGYLNRSSTERKTQPYHLDQFTL
jgi:hypothetical protein